MEKFLLIINFGIAYDWFQVLFLHNSIIVYTD